MVLMYGMWMAQLSQRSIIIYQRNFSSIDKNKTPEINPGVRKQIELIRVDCCLVFLLFIFYFNLLGDVSRNPLETLLDFLLLLHLALNVAKVLDDAVDINIIV